MKRVISATIAISAVACGSTDVHEVLLARPGAPSREVAVYAEGQALPRPARDVALLQVFATGSDAAPSTVLRALGGRGAELGCDAVVRARVDEGRTMSVGYAVCVRWSP